MPRNSNPRSATRRTQQPKEYDRRPRSRRGRDYRLSVRGELRKEPDVNKIARVVLALAMAQAEADAEAAAQADAAVTAEPNSEPDHNDRPSRSNRPKASGDHGGRP